MAGAVEAPGLGPDAGLGAGRDERDQLVGREVELCSVGRVGEVEAVAVALERPPGAGLEVCLVAEREHRGIARRDVGRWNPTGDRLGIRLSRQGSDASNRRRRVAALSCFGYDRAGWRRPSHRHADAGGLGEG